MVYPDPKTKNGLISFMRFMRLEADFYIALDFYGDTQDIFNKVIEI